MCNSAFHSPERRYVPFRFLRQRRQLVGVFQQPPACLGKNDPVSGPVKKADGEFFLQGLNLQGYRGLSQKERFSRLAKIQFLRDRAEYLEPEILHGCWFRSAPDLAGSSHYPDILSRWLYYFAIQFRGLSDLGTYHHATTGTIQEHAILGPILPSICPPNKPPQDHRIA